MGTLGDGLAALRALALLGHLSPSEKASLREKLCNEMAYEAKKFLVYRQARYVGRELLSLHRLRCLSEMLRHAA